MFGSRSRLSLGRPFPPSPFCRLLTPKDGGWIPAYVPKQLPCPGFLSPRHHEPAFPEQSAKARENGASDGTSLLLATPQMALRFAVLGNPYLQRAGMLLLRNCSDKKLSGKGIALFDRMAQPLALGAYWNMPINPPRILSWRFFCSVNGEGKATMMYLFLELRGHPFDLPLFATRKDH
jgi:hypothetical protein